MPTRMSSSARDSRLITPTWCGGKLGPGERNRDPGLSHVAGGLRGRDRRRFLPPSRIEYQYNNSTERLILKSQRWQHHKRPLQLGGRGGSVFRRGVLPDNPQDAAQVTPQSARCSKDARNPNRRTQPKWTCWHRRGQHEASDS
jgi:hypothetical protein